MIFGLGKAPEITEEERKKIVKEVLEYRERELKKDNIWWDSLSEEEKKEHAEDVARMYKIEL